MQPVSSIAATVACSDFHCGRWALLSRLRSWLALCGLLYGYFKTDSINLADYRGWFIPDDVVNLRRFLCAGYMHNSSYLGSVLGIVAGWIFQVAIKFRTKDEAH